jgi:polysaccharide export outer membrane protein
MVVVIGLLPILLGATCLHSGALKPWTEEQFKGELDPHTQEFVLGPGDVLRINVWRNPDLSTEATVRPDGTITMPLIGDLKAGGRTTAQLKVEIGQRLTAFVKDEAATVSIAITQINSYQFTVSGNVEHQGRFNSTHFVSVTEAIALAGGPTRFADLPNFRLIRLVEGGPPKIIPIDYEAMLKTEKLYQNIYLLRGDTLHVP